MKINNNLISANNVCILIDNILIKREILKNREHYAKDTETYINDFLKNSCLYKEIFINDELFYKKQTIKKIMSYISTEEITELVNFYK